MSPALHSTGRPVPDYALPVLAAGIAFLAAFLGPVRRVLRGDLQGLLGVVPPGVVELLGVVIAPLLALVVGARLATDARNRFRVLLARVAGGALVGAVPGAVAGFVLVDAALFGLARATSSLASVSALTLATLVAPVVVAVTVGVVAGVTLTTPALRAGTAVDGVVRPGRPTDGRRVGPVAVAGVCGLGSGFVTLLGVVSLLFATPWSALGSGGDALFASLGLPLVAVTLAAVGRPVPLDRTRVGRVGGVVLAGYVVGVGLAAAVAVASGGRLAVSVLSSVAVDVVVDGVDATAVLVLAVVVGVALGSTTASPRP